MGENGGGKSEVGCAKMKSEDEDTEGSEDIAKRKSCCEIVIRKLFPKINHFWGCIDVPLRVPVIGIGFGLGVANLLLLSWHYGIITGRFDVGSRPMIIETAVDHMFLGMLHTIWFTMSIVLLIGAFHGAYILAKIWVAITLITWVVGILYTLTKDIISYVYKSETSAYTVVTSITYAVIYALMYYFMAVVKNYYFRGIEPNRNNVS